MAAFAALLLVATVVLQARAQLPTVWVGKAGADNASCGSQSSPCGSIKFAVETRVAAGGEVAVIDSGVVFDEQCLRFNASVHIRGVGRPSVAFAGTGCGGWTFVVNGGTVTLTNLSLSNGVAAAGSSSLGSMGGGGALNVRCSSGVCGVTVNAVTFAENSVTMGPDAHRDFGMNVWQEAQCTGANARDCHVSGVGVWVYVQVPRCRQQAVPWSSWSATTQSER